MFIKDIITQRMKLFEKIGHIYDIMSSSYCHLTDTSVYNCGLLLIFSYSDIIIEREVLMQKYIHLVQIVETEKVAANQLRTQLEDQDTEIERLKAEVQHARVHTQKLQYSPQDNFQIKPRFHCVNGQHFLSNSHLMFLHSVIASIECYLNCVATGNNLKLYDTRFRDRSQCMCEFHVI